jgi:hypothetical protein
MTYAIALFPLLLELAIQCFKIEVIPRFRELLVLNPSETHPAKLYLSAGGRNSQTITGVHAANDTARHGQISLRNAMRHIDVNIRKAGAKLPMEIFEGLSPTHLRSIRVSKTIGFGFGEGHFVNRIFSTFVPHFFEPLFKECHKNLHKLAMSERPGTLKRKAEQL